VEKELKGKKAAENGTVPASGEDKSALRIILGLVFGALTLFSFVALLSYMFTWAEDQSLLSQGKAILGDAESFARNGGGKVGFLYANLLITKLFGFGAFAIPFLFLALTFYCLKIHKFNLLRILLVAIFGSVATSLLCSYICGFTNLTNLFGSGAGGSYGEIAVKWLISMLGKTGAGCVVVIIFFGWLVLINPKIAGRFDKIVRNPDFDKEPEPVPVAAPDIAEAAEEPEEELERTDWRHERKNVEPEEEKDGEDEDEEEPAARAAAAFSPMPSAIKADKGTVKIGDQDDGVEFEVTRGDDDFLKDMSEAEKDRLFDPTKTLSRYQKPPLSLLLDYKDKWFDVSSDELQANKSKIVTALANYKIEVKKISADVGPTVTLYKIIPKEGTRIRQIRNLDEDLAMSLGAKGVRVVTLEDCVGIEVANEKQSVVALKAVLGSQKFRDAAKNMDLPVALGLTVSNEPFFFDLAKMPHLLVAGATGMGKSVGLNSIITSLLYTKHPSEIKFVMVDPKKVELSMYSKIGNDFLAKMEDSPEAIITDTQRVVYTLKSLCIEMDARYDLLSSAGVRKISEYNEKFLNRRLNPNNGHRYLPFIVVIVDEFADLMMTAGREIEEPICRLAQKARAIGIHLVIATQRPTTDVITGTIKANFNSRIAFRVMSSVDSKTIIDSSGANRLIGRGDMLVMGTGIELTRVQCALIDTEEIESITKYISEQQQYSEPYILPEYVDPNDNAGDIPGAVDLNKRDEKFSEAATLVVMNQSGSTSLIQRKMGLGYNRSGRIMDQLEAAGIVGPMQGSKARDVLVTDLDSLDRILQSLQ
jgi:S-DNA-T family DNA segregation ATPase FtsK/SpoIIIE